MTPVEIINSALAMMGVNPIMALTDDTKTAQIVNQLYEPSIQYCLSLHNWNFALKLVILPKLSTNDNPNWQYAYQEPTDVLKIESVRDSNNQKVDYEEIGTVIYSNVDGINLKYVYRADETLFPPYFIEIIKFKLASDLSLSIVGNLSLYANYVKMFEEALRVGRGLDSQRGKMNYTYNSQWLAGLR